MLADDPLPGLRCSAANRGPRIKIRHFVTAMTPITKLGRSIYFLTYRPDLGLVSRDSYQLSVVTIVPHCGVFRLYRDSLF